jgi:Ala-tRNA(Pro) deacylase
MQDGCTMGKVARYMSKEMAMPVKRITQYLKKEKVKYKTLKYKPAYTAQEVAASAHIPGHQLAKSVMVQIDGEMAMAVLSAAYQIDFNQLKKTLGAKKVTLATEKKFEDFLPDCELGSTPPFGNLYDLKVLVDKKLTAEETIAFCSGKHSELIQLAYQDFERLVKPEVIEFSIKPE